MITTRLISAGSILHYSLSRVRLFSRAHGILTATRGAFIPLGAMWKPIVRAHMTGHNRP